MSSGRHAFSQCSAARSTEINSAQISRVTERVASRLRPDGETVGLGFHSNTFDGSVRRVDDINGVVVAAGEPKLFAVDADIAHIRAAAAGNRPSRFYFAGCEVDHADAAFAFRWAIDAGDAAIGDVKFGSVTTW